MEPRFVHAPITLELIRSSLDHLEHNREYLRLSDLSQDPIGQWLKMAYARGEAQESDRLLLTLLVELHRKVDRLEKLIKGDPVKLLDLGQAIEVDWLGFEHIKFNTPTLETDQIYYARAYLPTLTNQPIPLFLRALNPTLAHIERIHERDAKEWDGYIFARERMGIQEARRS